MKIKFVKPFWGCLLNKQVVLGAVLVAFGALMVVALLVAPKSTTPPTPTVALPADDIARPVAVPLTADIETETKLLEEKKRQRQARVAKLEAETKALIQAQEKARQIALKKAQDELTTPTVQARPDAMQATAQKPTQDKAAQPNAIKTGKHTVQAGDTLIGLAKVYGIDIDILAQANNMSKNDALQRGKAIKIPTAKEIKALQAQLQVAQRKEAADARLKQARQNANKSDNKGNYAVQVALAANQENADILVARFKAQGYRVKTAPDRRGVRVIIGPEKSQEAAHALKDKINSDPSVATGGAWVFAVK